MLRTGFTPMLNRNEAASELSAAKQDCESYRPAECLATTSTHRLAEDNSRSTA